MTRLIITVRHRLTLVDMTKFLVSYYATYGVKLTKKSEIRKELRKELLTNSNFNYDVEEDDLASYYDEAHKLVNKLWPNLTR